MIFPEFMEPLQLWRAMPPVGAMSDPVWTLITTVSGRVEPVMGDEEFLNNQTFAKVTEILFLPIDYKRLVRAGDGILDADGIQHRIVGRPEIWKSMLPYVSCKLEPVQWTMVT